MRTKGPSYYSRVMLTILVLPLGVVRLLLLILLLLLKEGEINVYLTPSTIILIILKILLAS